MIARTLGAAALALWLGAPDAWARFADPHLAAAPFAVHRAGGAIRWRCPVDMRAQPFPSAHGYRWGCVPWR
jgi:hypothetical protein